MITTVLQQASQIVEIQGAPPAAAKGSEGEFRASFVAASDGGSSAPKVTPGKWDLVDRLVVAAGELPSSTKTLIAAAASKVSPVATIHTTPTPFNLKAAVATEDAVAGTELESRADLSEKAAVTTDVGIELQGATQNSPQADGWIAGVTTAKVLATVVVDASETAGTAKTVEAKKSAPVSHASTHASDVPSSEKKRDAVAGSADPTFVAASSIYEKQLTAFSPASPVPESDGTSLAQRDSKPGIPVSVSEASDITPSSSAAPAGLVKSGDVASELSGLTGPTASRVTGLLASSSAVDPARTIQLASTSKTKVVDESAEVNGLGAKSLSKAGEATAPAHQTNVLIGLTAPPSIADEVASKPVVPRQQTTRNNVESVVPSDTVKAGPFTGPNPAVVEKAQASPGLRVLPAWAQPDAQLPSSTGATNAQESVATAGDKDAIKSPRIAVSEVPVTSKAVPSIGVQSKDLQASIGVTDGALRNASATDSSSRVAVVTAKSEKTKPVDEGAGQPTAVSANVSGNTVDARSMNASTASALPANSSADRAISGAALLVPVAQGVLPSPTSSVHAGNLGTATAGVAGALSTAGSATVSESSLPVVPIAQSHQTLLATPTSLEVGVQSGTQGWLRIRAEVGDQGGVNATLAAGSSGGRDLLHNQMPALNAFLHSEQIAVTTTVVDRASLPASGNHGGLSQGTGSQDGFGNSNSSPLLGGGAQNHEPQRDSSKQLLSLRETGTATSYDARSSGSASAGVGLDERSSEESGQWLNVRV